MAEFDKGAPFEAEEVVFAYLAHFGEVSTGHNIAEFLADQLVVFGDIMSAFHAVGSYVNQPKCFFSEYFHVLAFYRFGISFLRQQQSRLFCISELIIPVYYNLVGAFTQVAQLKCFVSGGGNFCLANSKEAIAKSVYADVAVVHFIARAHGKFGSATTTGDHAYTKFNQAHVKFGMCDHLVGVHTKFAATAQCHLMGSSHDRNTRVAHPQHGILKLPDGHFELVVFLLSGHHKDHADIGTGAKIITGIRYDETFVTGFGHIDCLVEAFDDIAANGIHLGVELYVDNAIAEILNRYARVFPEDGIFGEVVEEDLSFKGWYRFV